MINSLKKLSNRLSIYNNNNNNNNININKDDINRSNVGFLVVSLLFWCFSENDLKLREVNNFLKSTFDFYHLSNYQINQLYETHSQLNYLYQKQQQKQQQINIRNKLNNKNNDNSNNTKNLNEQQPQQSILDFNYDFELYNKQFINELSTTKEGIAILSDLEQYCSILKKELQNFLDVLESNQERERSKSNNQEEQLNNSYDQKFENYIDELGETFQKKISTSLNQLVSLFPKDNLTGMMSEAIESFILIHIFGQIFPINKSKDDQLKRIIAFTRDTQPILNHIDVKPQVLESINWDAAITDLSTINLHENPRDKIMCILRACRHISKGLSKYGSFGADEFIGYLIYLTIKTNPSYLYSNLKFIELFRAGDLMVSEEGYYFISLKMATDYIESKFKDLYLNSDYDKDLKKEGNKDSILNNNNDNNNNNNNCSNNNNINNDININNSIPNNNINNNSIINNLEKNIFNSSILEEEIISDPLLNNNDQDKDEYQYEVDDSDEPLIQDILENSDEILSNITSLAITNGYNAFVRSALKRFALKLHPSTLGLKLLLLENTLSQKLLQELQQQEQQEQEHQHSKDKDKSKDSNQSIIKKNIINVFERTRSNNRALKIALATIAGGGLLAVGGLVAAPLIGAALHGAIGMGILSAISMTGLTGTTVSTILFGATGATISATRMTKHTSGLNEFEFRKVNGSFGLNVVIGALGWVQEKTGNEDLSRWESNLFSGILCLGEVYSIKWETSLLYSLYKSLHEYKLKVEDNSTFNKFAIKMMHDAILPSASLLEAGSIISTNWGKVKDRAQKAGKLLAEEILTNKSFGSRPITLVGISMGARIIYYCLCSLIEQKAYGVVENVLFIGGCCPNDSKKWKKIRKIVSGRVVNCYSPNDILLKYFYEANNLTDEGGSLDAIGYSPIKKSQPTININNSNINNSNNSNNSTNISNSNNTNIFPFKFKFNNHSKDDSLKESNNKTTSTTTTTKATEKINIVSLKAESSFKINKKNLKDNELKELNNKYYLDLIEDVDVSSIITSHLDYQKDQVQRIIFSHVNIDSVEQCPNILMTSPNTILFLEESMKKQKEEIEELQKKNQKKKQFKKTNSKFNFNGEDENSEDGIENSNDNKKDDDNKEENKNNNNNNKNGINNNNKNVDIKKNHGISNIEMSPIIDEEITIDNVALKDIKF
ncbi:hypothetical protein DICPUDRAFT_153177 [Dictyostelium purpureum]|uniref:VPS9 domain-containing protein n=1 Tax=Dictyostelium purpureum TaxID=5786 RepID=F0ZN86_DICPU|nr:uncharacterized protein DICPUDRAFT_153177 [Dictyostelium purpureum]EGC34607.1 hypothetical protein DICPUDRAFT_153177 [Dictyostelium purpureum]|eukprot:XP_003288884.1 hypothetical protein DICPUDRAFT_153177 [Dictyostelium purpureum]